MALRLREIRLHLECPEGLRRVSKLIVARQDASIYLVPYATRGEFYYGRRDVANGQATDAFGFREQLFAHSNPKLSIHETGQVHIYIGEHSRAGPLQIAPLRELRGEHIASVQWDSVEQLQLHTKKPKSKLPDIDCAFGVPEGVVGGAILLFANGERSVFRTDYVHFALPVKARSGPPIFFGLAAVAKPAFVEGGVTVLAGFDARRAGSGKADSYLYLRGS